MREWPPRVENFLAMEDDLRQQLADWVEFYRELGIEDFYRRRNEPEIAPAAPEAVATIQEVPLAPVRSAVPEPAMPIRQAVSTPAERPARPSIIAGVPSVSLNLFEAPPPPRPERETLKQIENDLGDCRRCRLSAGRKTIVFGEGNERAALVFVGEGPGADEDEQGRPFVGRAGQLLNRMIQFIGMKRSEVYICNIVKCRPPENRTPERDEIETCSPFLLRQIEVIQPRLVCCLGAPAVRTLLGLKEGILKIRGQFFDYGAAKALATVHPAYILRNPREEKILREDFEKIRQFLEREK